ncbi:beta-carotene 15,15'-monooxygenase [Bacillus sp. RO3]|nr:beta-carotene 15,15'-monooxygenase [Bacillus sp. RO3]
MVLRDTKLAKWALGLLAVVLLSNWLVYQPMVQRFLSIELEMEVVIGSMVDLMMISPALAYAAFKLSKKQVIGVIVFGLVLGRVIIPEELFAPFTFLLYSGIGVEVLLLAAELGLIFLFVRKIPGIRSSMQVSGIGPLFSFLPAVGDKVSSHMLLRILSSEGLMMYYALFSWRKKPPVHEGAVTMHHKTSAVAMNIMLIHAVVIETIGIHWWLHTKLPILSFILLILNVYTVLLFIAEIQITRLHPLEVKNDSIYVTQGLMQRMVIPLHKIDTMEWGATPGKDALVFMCKDFEEIQPQVVLFLKEPLEATMFMGRKKQVSEVALRVDEPEKLKKLMET